MHARFGEIIELFEDNGKKMVHIRWYDHASKTLIQEAHHPRELFATNLCESQQCRLISGKCVVERITPDNTPSEVKVPQYAEGTPENRLFYRCV